MPKRSAISVAGTPRRCMLKTMPLGSFSPRIGVRRCLRLVRLRRHRGLLGKFVGSIGPTVEAATDVKGGFSGVMAAAVAVSAIPRPYGGARTHLEGILSFFGPFFELSQCTSPSRELITRPRKHTHTKRYLSPRNGPRRGLIKIRTMKKYF
jgi:hypothetical protein